MELNKPRKKALILCTLDVLKRYSNPSKRLTQIKIIEYLKKDYNLNVTENGGPQYRRFNRLGYEIETPRDGRKGMYTSAGNLKKANCGC